MQTAAVYLRDPLRTPRNIVTDEARESLSRILSGKGLHSLRYVQGDTASGHDEFSRTISEATLDNSILDLIFIWKLHRLSMSLEEAI